MTALRLPLLHQCDSGAVMVPPPMRGCDAAHAVYIPPLADLRSAVSARVVDHYEPVRCVLCGGSQRGGVCVECGERAL